MLYSEDNTDEEQENLPYDGDLQNRYQLDCDSQNVEDFPSVEGAFQSFFTSHISNHSKEISDCKAQLPRKKINLVLLPKKNDMEFTLTTERELQYKNVKSSGKNEKLSNSKISDVLLRHFPKEELSNPCHLIDSETIPEISYTESFDETILNQITISESTKIYSLQEERKQNLEREIKSESVDKNWDLIKDKYFAVEESTNPSCDRKDYKQDNPIFSTQKNHVMDEKFNYIPSPKEKYQDQKYFLETTGSFHNPKYGQRQVHYRLPDFSKVAPKVKIPKGNNTNPIIKRTNSSPNVLSNSATVGDVLVNSLESAAIKKHEPEMSRAELDQQLEMLTKQAEAQNLIDQLRFNAKKLPCSNSYTSTLGVETQGARVSSEISAVSPITVPVKPMPGFSVLPLSESNSRITVSPLPMADKARQSSVTSLLHKVTEEEKLSQMLKERSEELKAKVEIFSKCVTQDALPVQECHQLLMLLKEQLDQLEQNYLDTKEKHCALQLQNHEYRSTYVKEFDPDRKLEGEIFKLGMLLEDMKEKIDKTYNPHFSTFVASSSCTPCESVSSSYSNCSENPAISNICEYSHKSAMGMNVFKTGKYGENRTSQKIPEQCNQAGRDGTCHQDQPELQKKSSCKKMEESLEKSVNKESIHAEELQSHRALTTNQSGNNDQENTDRNLCYWEMRSPPPASPQNTNHQEPNTVGSTEMKEQGSIAYSADHCFFEKLENSVKEHNIIIHPMLKIQLSRKQACFCSSSRNTNIEHKKTNRGKSDYERFSVFSKGTAVDLDYSGSNTEDTSFCDQLDNSSASQEQRLKTHQPLREDPKEQNKASAQKKKIVLQRISTNKQPEEFIDRLCDRQKLYIPQTRYSRTQDTIMLSPQYLASRNIYGKKSACNPRYRQSDDTNTMILNSSLDHVIQTANNLKKTTEHMMQVISEDLAKAKIQTFASTASQY
ncbi:protein AKNAD1 [Varanus komodoensis]|uniref:protein AKNAD1 n=1 Tax=Varanus komodoensis TaxID=61221 RepID=UPI001CF78921|nr:protein AKNAD1 [Varanus komodoensis]XP_044288508.1 protein AKNAD1 [Varanus komodoensis]